MLDFQDRVRKEYANLFSATVELTGVAAKLLPIQPEDSLQRAIRFLTASMTNSNVALALLCLNGHGADAVRIARGMFETQVTRKYLLLNPSELRDLVDFDAVARWKRLQFYKAHHPDLYKSFPDSKKSEVEDAFARVRERFVRKNGKMRDGWCRYSIAEMARRTGLGDMYKLFYRYASALHHVDPMGLGMLIDGDSLDVQPAPSMAHIGIALGIGNSLLLEALRDYDSLRRLDSEDALKRVEQLLGESDFTSRTAVIGSLEHVLGHE